MIWSPILALALLLLDGKPVPPCGDWKALEEDAIEKGYLSGPLEEVASLYAKAAKAAECLQEPPEEIDRLWLRYADWLSLDHPGQAVAFAERRLKEIRNKYGDRHPRETRYLWFEGYYLRHPRVDVPRAERALLRALRIQREANGDESIEAAMALRRMASFYAETDKPEEALRTIDQAIRLAEKAGRAGRGLRRSSLMG